MLFYHGNLVIALLLGERVAGELIRHGGHRSLMGEDTLPSTIYE